MSAIKLYMRHDKIMLKETGEVLTVHEDLSGHIEPGIIVQEKIRRLVRQSEVRPAGHTRQRADIALSIVMPELPPPPPENCMRLAEPHRLFEELQAKMP